MRDERPDAERSGTGSSDAPSRSALTAAEFRPLLAGLMVAMFLAALDQTIVAIALPTIGRQFNDMSNLSWIVTAYLLSGTAVAPVFGTLSDIFGRRVMIVIALGIFVAGSVLCALAPNMLTLILARFLQGIGGGGIIPVVQTIIADAISPKERGEYQAYFSSVWLAAGLSGPLLGGVITEYLHWSAIFWINLPLTAVALAVLLPRLHRLPVHHRRRKVDWLGGALLMSSAVVILLVLTWGGVRYAWSSALIVTMIVGAVALLVAFVWHAERTTEPFLPLRLLGGSVVPFAILAGGLTVGCLLGLTVYLPMFYEVVHKLSASEAGLALLPLVALSVPGSWVAGRVMMRRPSLPLGQHRRWRARRRLLRRAGVRRPHVAVGVSCRPVGRLARRWADVLDDHGDDAERRRARPDRHRDRRDELCARADVVVRRRGLHGNPDGGAQRRRSRTRQHRSRARTVGRGSAWLRFATSSPLPG